MKAHHNNELLVEFGNICEITNKVEMKARLEHWQFDRIKCLEDSKIFSTLVK
jgi:hypothetical protein